jgi:FKBP-type peptidyl-prolyl cis-trans isomerase SlyD
LSQFRFPCSISAFEYLKTSSGKEFAMKAQVISFHCVLKDSLGHVISSTFNHDVLTGPPSGRAPLGALAEGLRDLKEGEKRKIALSAERAYGFYDPGKVITCAREGLSRGDIRLGDRIVGDHDGRRTVFKVIGIDGDEVTLDANHPLAGRDLVFEIEAIDVREATRDEVWASDLEDSGRFLH